MQFYRGHKQQNFCESDVIRLRGVQFYRGHKPDALAKNKITAAEKSVLAKLDLATLNDLVKAKPENAAVPGAPLPEPDKKKEAAALTAEEKKIALSMGLTEDEFAKAKKEGAKENE